MSQAEAIGPDELVNMSLEDLKSTSREIDVDPEDIDFPKFVHHMTVRGKLETLVEKDVINYTQMSALYQEWKEKK